MYFPLFPAPPRLQLVLYSDAEVRAALQPLRAIPAFTELLLTDPLAAPKQKRDDPAGDLLSQPQPDVPTKKVLGGEEPLQAEDKSVGASDPATPVVLMEIGGQEQAPSAAEPGTGAKPKVPSRKPRKGGKSAPAMGKGKILGKPPRPRLGPSAASLLPPLPDVLTASMESGPCFRVQYVPSSFRQLDVLMSIRVLTFLPRSEVMPNANPVARNSFIVGPILIT